MQPDIQQQTEDFFELLCERQFEEDNKYVFGYLEGEDNLKKLLLLHQIQTGARFSVRCSKMNAKDRNRLRWTFRRRLFSIPEKSNVPFLVRGERHLVCHKGARYYKLSMEKEGGAVRHDDHDYITEGEVRKRSIRCSDTKKVDCEARMQIIEMWFFPKLSIKGRHSTRELRRLRQKKQQRFEETFGDREESLEAEAVKRFYLYMPLRAAHSNHALCVDDAQAGSGEPVHPILIAQIHALVALGITHIKLLESLLRIFVEDELCRDQAPPRDNRSFFPTKRDLRNHLYRCLKLRQDMPDEPSLEKTREWLNLARQQHPELEALFEESNRPELVTIEIPIEQEAFIEGERSPDEERGQLLHELREYCNVVQGLASAADDLVLRQVVDVLKQQVAILAFASLQASVPVAEEPTRRKRSRQS